MSPHTLTGHFIRAPDDFRFGALLSVELLEFSQQVIENIPQSFSSEENLLFHHIPKLLCWTEIW